MEYCLEMTNYQLSISELKNPNKDTLRMFMTLHSKE